MFKVLEYVILLPLIPWFHFSFLKTLDQQDYDFYIGENARGPSFTFVDVDKADSDGKSSITDKSLKSFKSRGSSSNLIEI
jgi:hypothetical protein